MYLSAPHLPSQGKFILNQPNIPMYPLTFRQLVNYMSNPEVNDLLRYRRDLLLLQENGADLSQISLIDADYLIHFQKALTINEDLEFTTTVNCKSCGNELQKVVSTREFNFLDYEDDKIPSKILLGDIEYELWVPTIEEFLQCLDLYSSYSIKPDLDEIKLLSVFKDYHKNPRGIERAVLDARGKDAAKLFWLDGLLFDRVKPIEVPCNCSTGGEHTMVTVNINNINRTFFRDFLGNNYPKENEVHFEQVRKDG